jgi:Tfp pilus assembly protein PilX
MQRLKPMASSRNWPCCERLCRPASKQRGAALIAVLLLVLVSLGIGILSANSSRTELRIAHNEVLDLRALAVAEAGINQAKRAIEIHSNLNDELAANASGRALRSPAPMLTGRHCGFQLATNIPSVTLATHEADGTVEMLSVRFGGATRMAITCVSRTTATKPQPMLRWLTRTASFGSSRM